MKTVEAMHQFDNEFQVTSPINEVTRIGNEKFEELDKKHAILGKSEKTYKKAKEGANKLNDWLKKQ
ncbi:MAG: hypothetical protein ROO71_02830 [Balneola sp.]